MKYVSAAAEGFQWDVCGEYEVGMIEIDEEVMITAKQAPLYTGKHCHVAIPVYAIPQNLASLL